MKFFCPLCEREVEVENTAEELHGKHVHCPHCDQKFTFFINVPTPPPPAPLIIASGEDFENYLCAQINELACATCETTKASGDQGVDLVVTLKDGKKLAIQCKLYSSPVGNDAVQQIIAGKIFYKCDMAAVVSNQTYTQSAIDLANAAEVTLLQYTQIKDFVAQVGGGNQSKADEFSQILEDFLEKQHPEYSQEIGFHVKYKINPQADPREVVPDSFGVIQELVDNNRQMMLETFKLMNILFCSIQPNLEKMIVQGMFGRTLARIQEAYITSNRVANYTALDPEGKEGLLDFVQIVESMSALDLWIKEVKCNPISSTQIYKDELPLVLRNIVEHDLNKKKMDKETYTGLTTGRYREISLDMVKRFMTKVFGIKWCSLAEYLRLNRGECSDSWGPQPDSDPDSAGSVIQGTTRLGREVGYLVDSAGSVIQGTTRPVDSYIGWD